MYKSWSAVVSCVRIKTIAIVWRVEINSQLYNGKVRADDADKGGGVRDHHSYNVVCSLPNQRQRHQLCWILALEKVEQANKSLREMEMVE